MGHRSALLFAGGIAIFGVILGGAAGSPALAHGGSHSHHAGAHEMAAAPTVPSGFKQQKDALVHLASGMEFPRVLGNATLVDEATYGQAGDYVALRYRLKLSDGSVANVQIGIVDLPGMTARQHYDSRLPGVLARIPGAVTLEEAPLPGIDSDNFCGRFSDGDMVEGLVTVQFGEWGARAETEYARTVADEAHGSIAAFLGALNWRVLSVEPDTADSSA